MSDRPEYKAAWYQRCKNEPAFRQKRQANQRRYLAKPAIREKKIQYMRVWNMRRQQKQNEFS